MAQPSTRPDELIVYQEHPAKGAPFRSLVDLLEHQARCTPRAIAITFGERDFTYAELDLAATAVARSVAARISGHEPLVGLYINRCFEMIACLIGIMKAGAAYLPLDPGLPDARVEQIVAEARPVLVVAQEALASRLQDLNTSVLGSDEIDWAGQEVGTRDDMIAGGSDEQSLAYVLYTSGSTGRPKGVEVTHGSVLNLLASCRREPGITDRDVAFALARLSFDVSVLEIFLPLSCGARLVLLPENATRDPFILAKEIERHGATVVQAPPALWQSLIDTGWQGSAQLRAWSGAEALSRRLANRLLPLCREVWNCYGPTEATVLSTLHRVEASNDDVPIGHPIADTTFLILNAALRSVPEGHDGELCIGGAGVARGYRGRPELTAQRFVTAPGESTRIYRTGDLVRLGTDGLLHFTGRIDDQVKVRGFRVEPGEIEQALAGHVAVAACAVRVWPDAIGQNALFAYVVRQTGEWGDEGGLKAYLRTRLPDYMVPQRIIFLAQLPLTPNAKIDRAALPTPVDAIVADGNSAADVPAFTDTESRLAAIWRSLLGPIELSAGDDFFDLGGYSLLTVQLLLHIEDEFGRSLSTAELLSSSSLSGMAAAIDDTASDATSRRVIPIRPEGGGVPLYWLDAGPLLRPALLAVGGETPVFGLNLAPEDERELLKTGFDIPQLASALVAMLLELEGDRPFHLGGWCRWGTVAYETACQLEAAGHPPPYVVLLDTDLPGGHRGLRKAAGRLRRWIADPRVERLAQKSFSEIVGELSAIYTAKAYGGGIALIQPTIRKRARQAISRWAQLVTGHVNVKAVEGDHVSIVQHARALGVTIQSTLPEGGPP